MEGHRVGLSLRRKETTWDLESNYRSDCARLAENVCIPTAQKLIPQWPQWLTRKVHVAKATILEDLWILVRNCSREIVLDLQTECKRGGFAASMLSIMKASSTLRRECKQENLALLQTMALPVHGLEQPATGKFQQLGSAAVCQTDVFKHFKYTCRMATCAGPCKGEDTPKQHLECNAFSLSLCLSDIFLKVFNHI
jgi:hypothetical protein